MSTNDADPTVSADDETIALTDADRSEKTAVIDPSASRAEQPTPGVIRPTGVPTGRVKMRRGQARPARKARLRVAKFDPWSVMKISLMFSMAMAIIMFVAVALLWGVIEASGALNEVQNALNALLGGASGAGAIRLDRYIDRWHVMGFTATVCAINVVLMTAILTLCSFLYNLSSTILGGIEVTLAED